ncbi:MAG: aminoacyl-tRNA hydrolase [Alphaproteobacteria bacterium]|nr:aminoacyl-tRNA hydrolase [Alphaproteobacteria bacterium]
MDDCSIFVGLGNPGAQYSGNRHNVGFMIIDAIAEAVASSFFKKISSLLETSSFSLKDRKILLAKPLTYMNLSGRAVRFLLDFYKIKSSSVYVFHDDIDLEFGRIKIKKGGGNGGHNGLRSIDALIGTDYWRIRIGVGRPRETSMVASYVLHDFESDEAIAISQIASKISDNLSLLLSDPKKLEQELNKK